MKCTCDTQNEKIVLSDDEIKADDWASYTVFKQSHLEANAKLSKANERIRELEADLDRWFRDHRILNETFIKQCDRADRAEAKLRELREIIERNSKDLPAEFSRLVDDHFWEIA